MIEEDSLFTEYEFEEASSEIRELWGEEVDNTLENYLEHQIVENGVESTERQQVIVHYKPNKSFDEFHQELMGLEDLYRESGEDVEWEAFEEFENLANTSSAQVLETLPTDATGEHLRLGNAIAALLTPAEIKAIAAREDVEYVEYDKELLPELDQSAIATGVVNARNRRLAGSGKGIIIAVIDGEVDINHPDLKGRVVLKKNYTKEPWGNPSPHGTHVAGIIAGNGAKYKGMAPQATIWCYKIFPTKGTSSQSSGADAIEDVVKDMQREKRLRIANCSWGVPGKLDGKSVVSKIVERATKLGLVILKSAGNNGVKRPGPGSLTIPADAKGDVIIVGAASRDHQQVAKFSSRGPTFDRRPKPDILAPGEGIMAAKARGGYVKMSGTSMATPHIAGIVALMLERNPKLKPARIKQILMQTAKKLSGFDVNAQGSGFVDAMRALELARQPVPAQERITPIPSVKNWTLTEQISIAVRNTGEETMQAVKATLVSLDGIKVTSPEQTYGNLRVGAETARDFAIEVPSTVRSPQCKLSLTVAFTTPKGDQKTQSYKLTHEVPIATR